MSKYEFLKTEEEIKNWLNKYEIKNYELTPDEKYGFVVDVNCSVNLSSAKIKWIPIKFNKIIGNFRCADNKLTSLDFSPKIVLGDFNCSMNKIVSLKNIPEYIKGGFSCVKNKINSLEFFPENVGWRCYMDGNNLGKFNKLQDFKILYEEHKRQVAENLKNKIENKLINKNMESLMKMKL